MYLTKLFIASLIAIFAPYALAALNGSCTAGSHGKGVCVHTSECILTDGQDGSAVFYRGYCPNDPADVMCCIKIVKLGWFKSGRCLNVNDCNKAMMTGYCPGNSLVKLCVNA